MYRLQPAAKLEQFTLQAVDSEIGSLAGYYFCDSIWMTRYLLADSSEQEQGRYLLISPIAIGDVDEDDARIQVELLHDQIINSPSIGANQPVRRQFEEEYFRYYNWPRYWHCESGSGSGGETGARLRSSVDIRRCGVHARDGEIGSVDDCIIDTRYWKIRYLEVDFQRFRAGGRVLLCTDWIERRNWRARALHVDLSAGQIEQAPLYSRSSAISRSYEQRLFDHYGRRGYWQVQ